MPWLERLFLFKQIYNPLDTGMIGVNACGFWCAATMLLIVLSIPPSALPSDANFVKAMLSKLVQDYNNGGVHSDTLRNALKVYPLPQIMYNDPERRLDRLKIVSVTLIDLPFQSLP
jgi:hypothetical protein